VNKIILLADLAHKEIMRKGMHGDYSPLYICGITVTCADDVQSVRNRFCLRMRSVLFSDIDAAIESLEGGQNET